MKTAVSLRDIKAAARRISGYAVQTPLCESFSEPDTRFKLECSQPVRSFKIRGAANRILTLPSEKRENIVTASSGNHGLAVAYMARRLGIHATIVLPTTVVPEKLEMIRSLGASVEFCGTQEDERVSRAKSMPGMTLIGSFDEPEIIAGQGTCGLEIVDAFPDAETIFVPIGGGGLISGIASAVKGNPLTAHVRVIGVQPEGAPSMHESVKNGRITPLDKAQTVADGTSIRVPGTLTFSIVRELVDDIVLVSDAEILSATRRMIQKEHILAEPSGAESFAGLLKYKKDHSIGSAVSVVSGGNISWDLLRSIAVS